METLFVLLALLSLIATVVALINPKLIRMNSRKQALLVTIGAFFMFAILSGVASEGNDNTQDLAKNEDSDVKTVDKKEDDQEEKIEKINEENELVQSSGKTDEEKLREVKKIEEKQAKQEPQETLSQKNAVRKAEEYLDFMAFSKKGLIKQLEFEGFSNEDATYAVNKLNVDWKEQAVKKAEEYLDFTSFSRKGLIEQLEYEGFTREEATYAVDKIGL